jgi:anti-anti-sigma factor
MDAARDRFLAGLERRLQLLEDPAEIMETVVRLVGEHLEHLECDRCAYAEADEDKRDGVLVLRGDIDLAGRDVIGRTLLRAAAGPGQVVLGLTGVRYLSSAGVALLAEAAALAGEVPTLVVTAGSPARVLELTGLGAIWADSARRWV